MSPPTMRDLAHEGCLGNVSQHNPATTSPQPSWKQRRSPAGLHLFERDGGLNILIDEISVPPAMWSRAPRHVSIALTNRCDLACAHCFAPKSSDELSYEAVTQWLVELDVNGTLGVGFGGGEPTLYRRFTELCQHTARETKLAVTFTTHGHHIDSAMADELRGSVHFIRVSMDGVGDTYEAIRRRSFQDLQYRLNLIRTISRFGINVVVNELTLPELDTVAAVASDMGASELLLLPQVPTHRVQAIAHTTLLGLRHWVDAYTGRLKLCITDAHAREFPTCDPLIEERGLRAYAHIDASGVLKASSYHTTGIHIGRGRILDTLTKLTHNLLEKNT